MSQGRGSALLVAMVVLAVALHAGIADAATYTVGGNGGWTFNMATWPTGKRFKAGDTLVFNYNSGIHNLVRVNKAGYDNCSSPRGARVYQTGRDQIKLAKGTSYFICTIQGHCGAGMKIAVTAT